jgi:alpha-D-xyloside xylohydrolase
MTDPISTELAAGLNMGIAGIPWWTTDIGGFHGGDPTSPAFRELFVRWFQWGAFCPVMRLHGDREPKQPQLGTTGGATCLSGAPNEVWSYGEEVYAICKKYMLIREELRPYTRVLMQEAHEKGSPVMRPMFYEFPHDEICWDMEQQYMFGDQYLVAPILGPDLRKRRVYLPSGARWGVFKGDEVHDGGNFIEVDAPLDTVPVFVRMRD